eukprot:1153835-Pelagomonas_calceolata.AAC.5
MERLGCKEQRVCVTWVAACVAGMFDLKDFTAFKHHLRDFLVQMTFKAETVGMKLPSAPDA